MLFSLDQSLHITVHYKKLSFKELGDANWGFVPTSMIRTDPVVHASAKDHKADTMLASDMIVGKVINVVLFIAVEHTTGWLQILVLAEVVLVCFFY